MTNFGSRKGEKRFRGAALRFLGLGVCGFRVWRRVVMELTRGVTSARACEELEMALDDGSAIGDELVTGFTDLRRSEIVVNSFESVCWSIVLLFIALGDPQKIWPLAFALWWGPSL